LATEGQRSGASEVRDPRPAGRVRIWDLPTRLFHWSLAVCVAGSIISIKADAIDWHMRFGYAVLTLVLFRLLWGFAGSRYALFSHFVRGPGDVLAYIGGRLRHVGGHNPLGALSVLALLLLLLAQASGGLFANDGSFTEGPLAKLISGALSNRISTLHRLAEWAIYALILLHIAAVLFYTVFKFEPLVGAMLHGERELDVESAQDDLALRVRGLVVFALAAALIWYVVTL
jgi:cytochrome b